MARIDFENGKFFFKDKNEQKILLVDLMTSEENHSRVNSHQFTPDFKVEYPLFNDVKKISQKFSDGSMKSLVSAAIFFRIINRLLKKSQIQKVLHVGAWSSLDEVLDEFLPKFHDENFLYSLDNRRPIQNFSHTRFIFNDGDKYFLPENKFNTIIFSEQFPPPPEIILTAKNVGKIYFLCDEKNVSDEIKSHSEIFHFEGDISLFELTATTELKESIFTKTEQGIIDAKKEKIVDVISNVADIVENINSFKTSKKNRYLDELIKNLTEAEKNLAEIFPYLSSDTLKINLNMLKEFFIDFRLRQNSPLQKISAEKITRQYKVLIDDMKEDFS